MAEINKPQDTKHPISPALAGKVAQDNARTSTVRLPASCLAAAKTFGAVRPATGWLGFADRGQSIWVGRGRPSKSPELMAMRAAHLAATRAARVAKKSVVPTMGSVLRFVPPQTQGRYYAATQQKPVTIVLCACAARNATGRSAHDSRRQKQRACATE